MEAIKPEDLHKEIGKVQSTSWFKVDQGMNKYVCRCNR